MNSLYFEQALVPARSVALCELVETFLVYHKEINKTDKNTTKQAFRLLLEMFPENEPKPDTATFKVGYLIKFQNDLIGKGYARNQINRLIKWIKRVFSWGGELRFDLETWDKLPSIVSSQLVAEMKTIKPLKIGKGGKENSPRLDVPQEYVEAVFPLVSPIIADMLKIQLLTGMRPSEVCKMKISDIKRTKNEFSEYNRLFDGENWLYILPNHKTEKSIGKKAIPLGFQEQEILSKYLTAETEKPVFRNKRGTNISVQEYGRKIKNAIEENGLEKFVPYQIRHTSLSETSEEHGRDLARAVAGHTTEAMTARYDHADLKKTLNAARERNRLYREQTNYTGSNSLRIYNGE